MNGTSWLTRIAVSFAEAHAAYKAAPNPAQLFQPRQSYGGGVAGPISFPGYEEWYQRYANNENTKDISRVKTAIAASSVYADINAIAHEASLSRLQIVERQDGKEEDEEVINHPMEVLWESPNPFMGRSYVTQFWIWNLLLFGKAYLFWVPKGGSELGEVWPIPSFMIRPEPHPTQFITRYRFQAAENSPVTYIDRKYITFSRLVHPFDLRDGLSPIAPGFDAIQSEISMRRWNMNFFSKENATPSGLISVPKDMLDPDIARVRLEIQEFFGSGQRRVAVARAGDLDWKPFDRSQKDMEFLAGRESIQKEVDRLFGFPEGYWSDRASRANAEGAVARMIENAVWPHLVMLGEDVTAQTTVIWYGDQFRTEFEDIRPRNRALEQAEFKTYQSIKIMNELRAEQKLEPFEKDDPRGYMLLSEIEKQMAIPGTKAAELIDAAAPAEEEEAVDPSTMPPAELPEDEGAPLADGSNPTDADNLAPEPSALEAPMATPLEAGKAMDRRRWQTKALKAWREKGRAAVAFKAEYLDAGEQASIQAALATAQTAEAVRSAFKAKEDTLSPDEAALTDALASVLRDHQGQIISAATSGNVASLEPLGDALGSVLSTALRIRFDQVDGDRPENAGAAWVEEYVPGLIKGLNETTTEVVRGAIAAARAGATQTETVAKLATAFSPNRAEAIAITELTRAAAQATNASQAYLAGKGIPSTQIWRTGNDEHTCAVCGPRNGQAQGTGWDEPPPAHPRCRCFTTLEVLK